MRTRTVAWLAWTLAGLSMVMFLASVAFFSSIAARSHLVCASRKGRTSALLFSSTEDIEASSSPTPVSLPGRDHEHDATRRALAHRLEPYSPRLIDEGPRG